MIKIICVELTGQCIISLQFHVGDNLLWKLYEKNNLSCLLPVISFPNLNAVGPMFQGQRTVLNLFSIFFFSALKCGFLMETYGFYKMVQRIICIKTYTTKIERKFLISYYMFVSSYLSYTSFSSPCWLSEWWTSIKII